MDKVRLASSDSEYNLTLEKYDDSNNIDKDFIAYADEQYDIEFKIDTIFEITGLKKVTLTIGNKEYTTHRKEKNHILAFRFDENVFNDYIGYINIKLKFEYMYQEYCYYSKYFGVAVKDTDISDNTTGMLEMVVDNRIRYARVEKRDSKESIDNLELAKKIVETYKESIGWFKGNAITKLVRSEQMTDIDKVRKIDAKTIKSFANGRGLYETKRNGIRYNGNNYLARKVMSKSALEINTETYENVMILSFLYWVRQGIEKEQKAIEEAIGSQAKDEDIKGVKKGYRLTTTYIDNTRRKLQKEALKEYDKVIEEIQKVFREYKNILKCKVQRRVERVRFTGKFRNCAYMKIYRYMCIWNDRSTESEQEKVTKYRKYALGGINNDMAKIYEEYAFYELNRYMAIKNVGFRRTMKFIDYNRGAGETLYNNHIIYTKGKKSIEVYFEPTIDMVDTYGIGIVRNNNYKNIGNDEKLVTYTPDYVIKIKNKDNTRFIICDAKYCTSKSEEQKELLPHVAFKYGIGCKCADEKDEVLGIYIVRGIGTEENANIMQSEGIMGKMKFGVIPVNMDIEDNVAEIDKIFVED